MGFALNDRHSPTFYEQRIRFAGRWLMDGAKFLFPIILPCPAKRVSVSSVVHDSRTATCTPRKPQTIRRGRTPCAPFVHGWWSSAQIVMKYHAADSSACPTRDGSPNPTNIGRPNNRLKLHNLRNGTGMDHHIIPKQSAYTFVHTRVPLVLKNAHPPSPPRIHCGWQSPQ